MAEQQSARWAPATATKDESVERDRIFDNVAASGYLKLHRFLNQDGDCEPSTEAST
ncbi:hypothetical protein ACVWW6_000447 [Bradyrhizobium sp. USDA 3311]|uniref:hypothetical protein n=1 Tax=Bradyrhizobium sp. LCT2 TaxID=2493093 RepID=UPI001FF00675|nr:hypothetical protein [Bradyrhizobium sp. LCT2]